MREIFFCQGSHVSSFSVYHRRLRLSARKIVLGLQQREPGRSMHRVWDQWQTSPWLASNFLTGDQGLVTPKVVSYPDLPRPSS